MPQEMKNPKEDLSVLETFLIIVATACGGMIFTPIILWLAWHVDYPVKAAKAVKIAIIVAVVALILWCIVAAGALTWVGIGAAIS